MTLTREQIAAAVAAMSDEEREEWELTRRADQEARRRTHARDSLLSFVELTTPGYLAGWFHRDVCRRLEAFSEAVAARRSPRVILCAPPRSGKSQIVSRRFPVWHTGRHPTHEVICVSYGQDLANKVSDDARSTVDRYGRTLWDHMTPGRPWGVEFWKTRGGGSYSAAGMGGPITGTGAHIALIDDYVKNAEDARSEAIRERDRAWYQTTFRTRLAPGGGIIVMATRWEHDDLIGWLLEQEKAGGERWEVISYPALAEEDEPHRRAGEALHPERYSREELLATRSAIGERAWAALFQQRPTPAEGALFKRSWLKYYPNDPQRFEGLEGVAITVDSTFGKTIDGDFVVMLVWGRIGRRRYLLDRVRDRMSAPEARQALRMLCAKWPQARERVIELAGNGKTLIEDLGGELGLIGIKPVDNKAARAQTTALAFECGEVFLPMPERAPWVGEFVQELLAFPHGAHDDQVDAMTQLFNRWAEARLDDPKARADVIEQALARAFG